MSCTIIKAKKKKITSALYKNRNFGEKTIQSDYKVNRANICINLGMLDHSGKDSLQTTQSQPGFSISLLLFPYSAL